MRRATGGVQFWGLVVASLVAGGVLLTLVVAAMMPRNLAPSGARAPAIATAVPTSAQHPTTLATATPTATPLPRLTATPLAPTPTPDAPPRVGIQVGHWRTAERPDESAHLRQSTGAYYEAITEADVNYEVAIRMQALLEAEGIQVDLLDSTVPPAYAADAFISLHADGNEPIDEHAHHGWKMAAPFLASPASEHLLATVADAYRQRIDLPEDSQRITDRMRFYNSFNTYRYVHAIAPTTPAIIVEMGYLTHPVDRAVLLNQPDLIAAALTRGVVRYLTERDPADTAALQPPRAVLLQPRDTTTLRAAPAPNAAALAELSDTARLFGVAQANGWYHVLVDETWKIGWVPAADVVYVGE
jgi:N-acetylmuramoyl-L-alanine amidase